MNESQLKNVFRDVHNINKLLGRFAKQAAVLSEISVNSAIAAGHVGAEAAALSEIAKQIGSLSGLLRESVTEAHRITGNISNCILSCIVEANKHEKLLAASELMDTASEGNRAVLGEVLRFISEDILEQLCETKRNLQHLNPMMARLTQVIHRTWSIIMSLKVCSGIAEGEEESFFLPIARSLEQMAEKSLESAEELTRLIGLVDASLRFSRDSGKGDLYAA